MHTVCFTFEAGVKDTVFGDNMPFVISARCQSSDIRFDSASAEASGTTEDVLFPLVESISPAISAFVGQQVTIAGVGLDIKTETAVALGDIVVSGPPVMRTILHDEKLNRLFVVSFLDEEMVTEWEIDTSNGYRAERDQQSWDKHKKKEQRRRAKASKEKSEKLGITRLLQARASWYPKWSAIEKEQMKAGAPPVYSAADTYVNESLWDGTLHQNYFRYTKLEVRNMTNVIRHHSITPGPLIFRRVIASAVITDPVDALTQFTLYRELAQEYNFSRTDNHVSFITPTEEQTRHALDGGYVPIVPQTTIGTTANVTKLLLYTADCPQWGMFGEGLSCTKCLSGTH